MPRWGPFLLLLLATCSLSAQSLPDFSVAWISRSPKIDYVRGSAQPDVEGWPPAGSTVEWVAHVRNNGGQRAQNVAWRWTIGGEIAATGFATLEPGRYTEISLPWTWTFDRHEIAFEIDAGNAIAERQERNNHLLIHSDALSVAFYVEQSYWTRSMENFARFNVGATTLDDWLQIRIGHFNEMAALAVYPDSPMGVLDRWRIDAIHVVPDGALPLSPYPEVADEYPEQARPIRFPNAADRSVDIQWGFTDFYPVPSKPADLYDSLIHELGHARYLVDIYAWGITDWWKDRVNLEPQPPKSFEAWHHTPHRGLMNQHWGYIDQYSAAAMNLIAGHRALAGNYNPPENLGEFLNDLPSRNRVRLVRPDGTPIPHADVALFRSSAEFFAEGLYPKTYDAVADIETVSDAEGWIELPRNPFAEGPVVHGRESGFGFGSNVTAILRVEAGDELSWGYLESLDLNLAYWRGETELAEHEVLVGGPICSIARYPLPSNPGLESRMTRPGVFFSWSEPTPARSREVWVSVNGARPHLVATLTGDETSVTRYIPPGRIAWWVRADYGDGCPEARSATWFFDHESPSLQRRRGARRP